MRYRHRILTTQYPGTCACCGGAIPAGERVHYNSAKREITHEDGIKGKCFSVLNEKANGIESLAQSARPVNDDDWGSERQVAAENKFFKAVRAALTPEDFAALESFCHKARTEEMIDEALRLMKKPA